MSREIALLQKQRVKDSVYSRSFANNESKNMFIKSDDFSTSQYKPFSNFQTDIPPSSKGQLGTLMEFEIPISEGDMLRNLSLELKAGPLIRNGGTFASWTNTVGYAVIEYAELMSGGDEVCRMSGEAIEALFTLKYGPNDGSNSKNEMVGKYLSIQDLKTNANVATEYICPLMFWFSESPDTSIPLFLIRKNKLTLRIKLRPFEQIVNYDGDLPSLPAKFHFNLRGEFSLISDKEKMSFQYTMRTKGVVEYLASVPYTIKGYRAVDIPFKFPAKEMFMMRRTTEAVANNDWFNYSEFGTGKKLTDKITVLVENVMYTLDEKEGRILNNLDHYNQTNRYIYSLPFFEKKDCISGFLPLDTINSMSVKFSPYLETEDIIIVNCYNILQVDKDGFIKMKFI